MAASMWRMNGFWRRTAAVLLLCALLLHNGAVCQDDDTTVQQPSTVAPSVSPADTDAPTGAPGDAATTDLAGALTDATTADPAVNSAVVSAVDPTHKPEDSTPASGLPATAESQAADTNTAQGGLAAAPSTGPPANTDAPGHPAVVDTTSSTSVDPLPFTIQSWMNAITGFDAREIAGTDAPIMSSATEAKALPVKPFVVCVTEEALKDKDAVQVHLQSSSSCEDSKGVLEELLAPWCDSAPCQLDVFQKESTNNLLVTSPHAGLKKLEEVLTRAEVKKALGASEVKAHPVKSSSAVFVSVLMAGLLLAAGLIGAYCVRIRRGHNTKGMRLVSAPLHQQGPTPNIHSNTQDLKAKPIADRQSYSELTSDFVLGVSHSHGQWAHCSKGSRVTEPSLLCGVEP